MTEKFTLDLKSDPKVIAGTRLFDAPRALVFSAWTEPRHLAQWFGPNGFTLTTQSFDFRAGGIWRFVMHGPDGRDYKNNVTFDEIVRPERLAFRHSGEDETEAVTFKTVVTFEDLGAKTRLNMQGIFPSAEARERVIRDYGADKGQVETLARLGEYVSRLASASDGASTLVQPYLNFDGRCSGQPVFKGITLSIWVKTTEEADRTFGALANGGAIQMPLAETFFSPRFGMVADRFGVNWMVLVMAGPPASN